MDAARVKLDSELMQGNLTAYDINQMAAQKEYESLVPGTFITFNDLNVFDPASDQEKFVQTITGLTKGVENSVAFKDIQLRLNRINHGDSPEVVAALEAKRDQLYIDVVGPTIIANVEKYGPSFLKSTDGYLRSFLSPAYVDSLSPDTTTSTVDSLSPDTTTSTVDSLSPDTTTSTVGSLSPDTTTSTVDEQTKATLNAEPTVSPAAATEEEQGKSVKERAAIKFGIDPASFDAGLDKGELTELDLQVFADYGDDIMTYLKFYEYGSSSDGIIAGLAAWAQENNKILPMNKSFLVETFMSALEAERLGAGKGDPTSTEPVVTQSKSPVEPTGDSFSALMQREKDWEDRTWEAFKAWWKESDYMQREKDWEDKAWEGFKDWWKGSKKYEGFGVKPKKEDKKE